MKVRGTSDDGRFIFSRGTGNVEQGAEEFMG